MIKLSTAAMQVDCVQWCYQAKLRSTQTWPRPGHQHFTLATLNVSDELNNRAFGKLTEKAKSH